MATDTQQQFDDTGKVVFDDYYDRPDPRTYFINLGEHDYRIAGEAQPFFRKVLDTLRDTRNVERVKAIDLGCSYGINAALMKHDITLEDLSAHYGDSAMESLDRQGVLDRDLAFYRAHRTDAKLEVVGIDPAANAIRYGVDAGLLDEGLVKDLEEEPFSNEEVELLDDADLVMSTGCIGYVSEKSIEKLLNATEDDRPWMAHTVLRMFSFEPYKAMLKERGYVTEQLDGTLIQRRFADAEEKSHVLENLHNLGVDPTGKESDGWYHANVYVSRPVEEAKKPLPIRI